MINDVWLADAGDKAVPEKRKSERVRKKGYKLRDERKPNPDCNLPMSDTQVLECRRRYEFETGWDMKRLAVEYGVSVSYMRALLEYITRSKLIPKRP